MRELQRTVRRLGRGACVLGLVSIAFMVWSIVDPRPAPIVFAMSIGQVVGTVSLALYCAAVLAELRRTHLLRNEHRPDD